MENFLKKGFISLCVGAVSVIVSYIGFCFGFIDNCPLKIDLFDDFKLSYHYYSEEEAHPTAIKAENDNRLRSCYFYAGKFTPAKNKYWIAKFWPTRNNKYVYVFQVEKNQDDIRKISRLFPTEELKNPVLADETYYLPKNGKGFQLNDKVGSKKLLYFLTFHEPQESDSELEQWYQKLFEDDVKDLDRNKTNFLSFLSTNQEADVPVFTFIHMESDVYGQVDYVYGTKKSNLRPLTDGSELFFDDKFRIQFMPTKDSYIYVYHLDETERVLDLVDKSDIDNHKVKACVSYTLPSSDRAFVPKETTGNQWIYFFAFEQPVGSNGFGNKTQIRNACLNNNPNCVSSVTFKYIEEGL